MAKNFFQVFSDSFKPPRSEVLDTGGNVIRPSYFGHRFNITVKSL